MQNESGPMKLFFFFNQAHMRRSVLVRSFLPVPFGVKDVLDVSFSESCRTDKFSSLLGRESIPPFDESLGVH